MDRISCLFWIAPIFSTASCSSPPPVSSFRLRFSSTSTRTRTLPTGLQMLRIFSPWLLLLYDLHILFIIPNILHSISFVQQPSSFIKPPRYTNSVTCSSVSPSIFTLLQCFSFYLYLAPVFLLLSFEEAL